MIDRSPSSLPGSPSDLPLERLLQAHLPELRGFIAHRADPLVMARESVADLVQSVCREILQHVDRFRHGSETGFRQWLYRTAERKLTDRYRYYTAERRDSGRELAFPAENLLEAAFATPPGRSLEAREELARLKRALGQLPPHYREVIRLARVERLPHAEIAQRLERSEGAVRNLLYRGLAAVTVMLEREG